jgi:uncharacterized repeat protein (TIGR02059 family)
MRVETLPSPGLLSNGIRIRIEAAKAISAVEINAGVPANNGRSSAAAPLRDFFQACADALTSLRDVTAPTIQARSATNANRSLIVLTYNEGLDATHVPPTTAFAVTGQVRTVTEVQIDGPFVFLTLNTPLNTGAVSVAYTQPGTANLRLQDVSGNVTATFAATAVTNTIS